MNAESNAVKRASELLEQRFGAAPSMAVVLGSGLGGFLEQLDAAEQVDTDSVGLLQPRVAGHGARVWVGGCAGHTVAVAAGRVHLYEGYTAQEVVRTVRAFREWGVERLILTNAVGGVRDGFDPGTLVVVRDHLNLQGTSPLVGGGYPRTFVDVSAAYDPTLRRALLDAATAVGAPVREGVLAAMLGPSYETPAEVRMLGTMGADVVGMSTVPEVLAAAAMSMPCGVLSMVTNHGAGRSDDVLSHDDVTRMAATAGAAAASTLSTAIERLLEEGTRP
ncbi:MAG: purine-nucleoside phosphorylase [Myxococcales bacterium]|nr:purine-nucleoside phosphorylase [Myxococcales bacterium]